MKLVSWNVNSIKAREEHVKTFLEEFTPDVLMIQELKGENFPTDLFKGMGFESAFVGQKSYNGVALLAKAPIEIILDHLPGDDRDEQARYIEADINGIRVINIYAPNGNPAPGDKYTYKLAWMARLLARLKHLREKRIPFVIGGDFNVIPEEKDCYDPKTWREDALFRIETRATFRSLLNLGLTDAFRIHNNAPHQYTFWDYQAGCWPKDHGIRIDHFLLSPRLADKMTACTINKLPRGWDRPSDHTPIMVEIAV